MIEMPTQKHNNACFGAFLFSGNPYGNLNQLCITPSMVTYFIPWAGTGTDVSHS